MDLSNMAKTIGIELKKERIGKSFTQEFVSKKSGVVERTLGTWENGSVAIKTDMLAKLLEFYGVSVNIFFDRVVTNM
jgi:transcriptional regulator with XRE-family HTH domain